MILFGYVVFDQFPDRWTLVGAAIIVASGLYIVHREHRLRLQSRTAPNSRGRGAGKKTLKRRRTDGITPRLNSLKTRCRGSEALAQKIKLSTIADALSVSTATVSLALRDSPLVADATRERIKEHARAIGYIYNRRAASLRTSRSGIVGVVVHDIMNPFFAEILRSIESELDRSRQTFLLSNHYDQLEKQRTFIDTLLQLGADGVIMSPAIGTPRRGHPAGRGQRPAGRADRALGRGRRTCRCFAATTPTASGLRPTI